MNSSDSRGLSCRWGGILWWWCGKWDDVQIYLGPWSRCDIGGLRPGRMFMEVIVAFLSKGNFAYKPSKT